MGIVCIDILSTIAAEMAVKIILAFALFFGITTEQEIPKQAVDNTCEANYVNPNCEVSEDYCDEGYVAIPVKSSKEDVCFCICGKAEGCDTVLHGEVKYTKVGEEDTSSHQCLDNSVYEKAGAPGSRFCFKKKAGLTKRQCYGELFLKDENLVNLHQCSSDGHKWKQVAVGAPLNGIWAISTFDEVFYRNDSCKNSDDVWQTVDTPTRDGLAFIAVGKDSEVWGADSKGVVYMRTDVGQTNPMGKRWAPKSQTPNINQLDVFGSQIPGVEKNKAFMYSTAGSKWENANGGLTMVASGNAGVWGVISGTLWYLANSCENTNSGGNWVQVLNLPAHPIWVEVTPVGEKLDVWITDGTRNLIWRQRYSSCRAVPLAQNWIVETVATSLIQFNAGSSRLLGVDANKIIYEAILNE